MPGPIRTPHAERMVIEEKDVLPYVKKAASDIGQYYSIYSDELISLANFNPLPESLSAVPQPNGDIFLRYSNGEEAHFDVIGMVVGSCLEVPPGFSKSSFPHFRRWVKVTAVGVPLFSAAVEARQVLYSFLALHATEILAQPQFLSGSAPCFRPSATMLTSLDIVPDATAVDVPPLYDSKPLEAAMHSGHGRYTFSSDNEVLFFRDEETVNGELIRREVCPGAVKVGQIVQIRMRFRLLKQDNGCFTFRELLKGVYILHDGAGTDIARKLAQDSVGKRQNGKRDVRAYMVVGNGRRNRLAADVESAEVTDKLDDMAL